jgi:hypothetical protein
MDRHDGQDYIVAVYAVTAEPTPRDGTFTYAPATVTPDELRRIIREELERMERRAVRRAKKTRKR